MKKTRMKTVLIMKKSKTIGRPIILELTISELLKGLLILNCQTKLSLTTIKRSPPLLTKFKTVSQ